MQWLGEGVITIGKKDYGYGETLPKNKLSTDRENELKAKGLIGAVPVADAKSESDPVVVSENVKLLAENKKLKEKVDEMSGMAGDNKDIGKKMKNLTDENEKLAAKVDELAGLLDINKGIEKEYQNLKKSNESMQKHIKNKATDQVLKEQNASLDAEVQQLTSDIEVIKKQLEEKE